MLTKILTAGSSSFLAAAVLATTPAHAYDPCQRAFERVERLEAEMRAYHRACDYPACLYTVRFNELAAELNAAREQRRRACNP
jgi:hypothetical protein